MPDAHATELYVLAGEVWISRSKSGLEIHLGNPADNGLTIFVERPYQDRFMGHPNLVADCPVNTEAQINAILQEAVEEEARLHAQDEAAERRDRAMLNSEWAQSRGCSR